MWIILWIVISCSCKNLYCKNLHIYFILTEKLHIYLRYMLPENEENFSTWIDEYITRQKHVPTLRKKGVANSLQEREDVMWTPLLRFEQKKISFKWACDNCINLFILWIMSNLGREYPVKKANIWTKFLRKLLWHGMNVMMKHNEVNKLRKLFLLLNELGKITPLVSVKNCDFLFLMKDYNV